jgi:hypothetical protein
VRPAIGGDIVTQYANCFCLETNMAHKDFEEKGSVLSSATSRTNKITSKTDYDS